MPSGCFFSFRMPSFFAQSCTVAMLISDIFLLRLRSDQLPTKPSSPLQKPSLRASSSCSTICTLDFALKPAAKLLNPRNFKQRYTGLPRRNPLPLTSRLTPTMARVEEPGLCADPTS